MSEKQIFCHADALGSDYSDSYQQKRYRIFNIEITESEYESLIIPKIHLKFDKYTSPLKRYQTAFKIAWEQLLEVEKQQFLDLPHFDSDIFFKITGVDVTIKQEVILTIAEIEAKLGIKNLKIVK